MAITDRRNAILDEVLAFNRDRKPKRVRLKLQRMDEGPFPCYETGCQALPIKTRMTRGSACYSCSRHQIGSAIASEGRRLFCAGPGPQGVTTRYPQLADPRWLRPDSLRSTCRSGSTWTSSKH